MRGDFVNVFLYYFLYGFGLLFAIPFLYIVITKSPLTLRVYRNTILNLIFWFLLAMFSAGFMLQPVQTMYQNKSCAKFMGLVSYFEVEVLIAVLFFVGVVSANVATAICICFVYRYDQLRRLNLTSYHSSFFGLASCSVVHILGSLVFGCSSYIMVLYADLVRDNDVFIMCFDDANYYMIARVAIVVVSMFSFQGAAVVILVFITVRVLRKQRAFMATQTYHLQKLLTVNLLILALLPCIFDFIPAVIASLSVYLKSDHIDVFIAIACHSPFLDVVLSCIATLGFVTPYRQAILTTFRGSNSVITPAVSITTTKN
ncbi:hypothetical protein QR680_016283 [Steinernema hermaphroditum]|uniref:Uncharacterized protein n=1 Tax=Steinernema hermaphroditum TaxID=289476 RepID=A0AA39LLQ4_9BILA|nr:hypothetical protein QR680_016283 [Steinernema hermaphroditum]